MTWSKIDDRLHGHIKVRRAGPMAMGLWVMALSYCADTLTGGFIASDVPELLVGTQGQALAERLVSCGLWEADGNGWRFHDYHHYNLTAEEARERKAEISSARAKAGRKSGKSRRLKRNEQTNKTRTNEEQTANKTGTNREQTPSDLLDQPAGLASNEVDLRSNPSSESGRNCLISQENEQTNKTRTKDEPVPVPILSSSLRSEESPLTPLPGVVSPSETESAPRAKASRKAASRPTKAPEPMPWTIAEMLSELARTAPSRAIVAPFDQALAKPLTLVIRGLAASGCTLADIGLAGEWFAAGGLSFLTDGIGLNWFAKGGNLADAIGKARKWREAGRPSLAPHGATPRLAAVPSHPSHVDAISKLHFPKKRFSDDPKEREREMAEIRANLGLPPKAAAAQ